MGRKNKLREPQRMSEKLRVKREKAPPPAGVSPLLCEGKGFLPGGTLPFDSLPVLALMFPCFGLFFALSRG